MFRERLGARLRSARSLSSIARVWTGTEISTLGDARSRAESAQIMRSQSCRLAGIFLVCLALASPVEALASCAPGGTPTYKDIEGIAVRRCGMVGFIYQVLARNDGFIFFRGQFNAPVNGYYDGHNGQALFESLLKILQERDFFSLRLRESPTFYIDGPCETVEIMRCGVVTAVGGLGVDMLAREADLKDAQTARFDSLVNTLQTPIFAWPWSTEHQEVTPTPAPTPH
jgi:hypothetical protein